MRYNRKMREALVDPNSADIGSLLEPHRAAIQIHCYRMTGSLQDAEDLSQEALLRAWRSFESFKGNSSLRTWLYRIATNVCLDALRKQRSRRLLKPDGPASDPRLPVGAPTGEALWLEPCPDSELIDPVDSPEEQLLMRESISLAFLAALQLLPPRQRAILILSDVLGWQAGEVGELLNASVSAVESALHRARSTLTQNHLPLNEDNLASRDDDTGMKILLDRYVKAWEANDLNRLVTLLREDVILSMPPFSSWYQGRDPVHSILSLHPFGQLKRAGWRLSPTRSNGQPAFILYRADQPGEPFKAFGLMVLSITRSASSASVSALTIFKDEALVARFEFPPTRDL